MSNVLDAESTQAPNPVPPNANPPNSSPPNPVRPDYQRSLSLPTANLADPNSAIPPSPVRPDYHRSRSLPAANLADPNSAIPPSPRSLMREIASRSPSDLYNTLFRAAANLYAANRAIPGNPNRLHLTDFRPIPPNHVNPHPPTAADFAAAADLFERANLSEDNIIAFAQYEYMIHTVVRPARERLNRWAIEAHSYSYWKTRCDSFYRHAEMVLCASGVPLDSDGVFRPASMAEAWYYKDALVLQSQVASLKSAEGKWSRNRLLERIRRYEGPGRYTFTIIAADGRETAMGSFEFAGMPV